MILLGLPLRLGPGLALENLTRAFSHCAGTRSRPGLLHANALAVVADVLCGLARALEYFAESPIADMLGMASWKFLVHEAHQFDIVIGQPGGVFELAKNYKLPCLAFYSCPAPRVPHRPTPKGWWGRRGRVPVFIFRPWGTVGHAGHGGF